MSFSGQRPRSFDKLKMENEDWLGLKITDLEQLSEGVIQELRVLMGEEFFHWIDFWTLKKGADGLATRAERN